MKKFKLLTSLSALGLLSVAAPVIVTGCSDKKSLNIDLQYSTTVSSNNQSEQQLIMLYATYDNNMVDIQNVEITSSDNTLIKGIWDSAFPNLIFLTFPTEGKTGEATLTIKVTDTENHTSEKTTDKITVISQPIIGFDDILYDGSEDVPSIEKGGSKTLTVTGKATLEEEEKDVSVTKIEAISFNEDIATISTDGKDKITINGLKTGEADMLLVVQGAITNDSGEVIAYVLSFEDLMVTIE